MERVESYNIGEYNEKKEDSIIKEQILVNKNSRRKLNSAHCWPLYHITYANISSPHTLAGLDPAGH